MPTTFWVTTTADNGGVNPAPGAGTGTLRQALVDANADPNDTAANPDVIDFNITAASDAAGGGTGYNPVTAVATIMPLAAPMSNIALPVLNDPIIINGYSQPGAQENTLLGVGTLGVAPGAASLYGDNAVLKVELDGSLAGPNGTGIYIGGTGGSVVEGLAINRFALYGIGLLGGANTVVEGDFIGNSIVTGTTAFDSGGNPLGNGTGVDYVGGGGFGPSAEPLPA